MSELLLNIIQDNVDENAFTWLKKAASADEIGQLGQAFVMLPRKTGKSPLHLSEIQKMQLEEVGLTYITGWSIDRLVRVWLLSVQSFADAGKAHPVIENLFLSAEMNEAIALYSALPFYAYPEEWIAKAENGIRSNIGTVLEAIMYHNPFAATYLSENSFNQLVLKAFFTEKDVTKISGLHSRVNKALQDTLSDYVAERTAAHRSVEPNIYHLLELNNQTI